MAEIIDFNRGKEEEIMDLSEFGTFVANEAETMINEKGPFNDPDEADGFCDAFTELGMIACVPLANTEWIGYYVSEEMPRGGLDAYAANREYHNLTDFISMLAGIGANAITDVNGPLMSAKAANELSNKIYYDANNKLCVPLANDWWLVYSVYENKPLNGVSVLDIYKFMKESEANQNG